NRGAQELYRRFGFAPAGVRKGYYGDNGEDALVMWAHDVATEAYAARVDGLLAGSTTTVVRSDVPASSGEVGAASAPGAPSAPSASVPAPGPWHPSAGRMRTP